MKGPVSPSKSRNHPSPPPEPCTVTWTEIAHVFRLLPPHPVPKLSVQQGSSPELPLLFCPYSLPVPMMYCIVPFEDTPLEGGVGPCRRVYYCLVHHVDHLSKRSSPHYHRNNNLAHHSNNNLAHHSNNNLPTTNHSNNSNNSNNSNHRTTFQTMTDQATLTNAQQATFRTWPLLTATTLVAKNISPYRAILKVHTIGTAEYIEMPPRSEKAFSRMFRGHPVRVMNDSGKFGSVLEVSAL